MISNSPSTLQYKSLKPGTLRFSYLLQVFEKRVVCTKTDDLILT